VTARFEVILNSSESQSLSMKAIDTKAPPVIRRLLTGSRINWDPLLTKTTPQNSLTVKSNDETKDYGVYKDRNKWVAVSKPKRSISETSPNDGAEKSWRDNRCFFLGRFDTESEAIRVYLKAQEDIKLTRVYVGSKGGKVVPPSIYIPPTQNNISTATIASTSSIASANTVQNSMPVKSTVSTEQAVIAGGSIDPSTITSN
jgi:hypothetical protein